MSKDARSAFDSQRAMTKILVEQGQVPTGNGEFVQVSEEAAKIVSDEVEKNVSFSQDEPEGLDL